MQKSILLQIALVSLLLRERRKPGGGWAGSGFFPPAGTMFEFSPGPFVASTGVSASSTVVSSGAVIVRPEVPLFVAE